MAVISSLLIRLGVTDGGVSRGFKRMGQEIDNFERRVNQSSAALNKLGRAGTAFGIGPAVTAAAGALVSFTAAAAPAVNTALALPAALAQGAAGMAVFKLATNGVGDAIKHVADGSASAQKDLAALSPEARRFAVTTAGAIKTLRRETQIALFAGWTKEFDTLSRTQGPMLAGGFRGIATELSGVARAAVQTAGTPLVSGTMRDVLASTALSTHALADATPSLIRGLASVIGVGNPLVTTLTQGALAAAKAKAEWLSTADGVAWMTEKLEQGRITMGRLMSIVEHLGATILHVFGGARLSAGDLLGRIDELAERLDRWSASAEGQEKILAFFDRARMLGTQIGEAFGRVIDVALKLANAFNRLPPGMQEGILTASAYAIVLGPLITKFSSLIGIMIQVGVAAGRASVGIFRFMFVNQTAAGTTRAAWLATRVQVLAIWLQLQVAAAASAARTAAAWAVTRVQIAAIWLSLQAQAIATSARTAAAWLASWAVQQASAIASMAVTVGAVVVGWVTMAAQSLAQAARMAAAWLIAMGPVGIVIAVIIALVALVIKNWDTIVDWTKRAWEWVWSRGIKPAIDFISRGIGSFIDAVKAYWRFWTDVLPSRIRDGFNEVNATISAWISRALAWFQALPGQVWSALSGMHRQAWQWGIDLVQGMINGLGDAVGRLVAKAREVASSAMNAIKSTLGIGSPSKITYKWMVWVGEGGVRGGESMVRPLERTGERMAQAAMRPWNALGETAPFTLDGQAVGASRPGVRGLDGDDSPDWPGGRPPGAPLVSIGNFYAGTQTPKEIGEELDYAARRR